MSSDVATFFAFIISFITLLASIPVLYVVQKQFFCTKTCLVKPKIRFFAILTQYCAFLENLFLFITVVRVLAIPNADFYSAKDTRTFDVPTIFMFTSFIFHMCSLGAFFVFSFYESEIFH